MKILFPSWAKSFIFFMDSLCLVGDFVCTVNIPFSFCYKTKNTTYPILVFSAFVSILSVVLSLCTVRLIDVTSEVTMRYAL